MSTMREVATRAGVSAQTVSRVLKNDKYVSDSARERVLRAVDELNYVPNVLAKTFRSGRDTVVGIAVPDVADPFFGQVTRAVENIARDRGVAVFVTSIGENPDYERPALEALLSRQLIGLIVAPIAADQSYLDKWQASTTMVFIDRQPRKLNADSVVEDDFGGAKTATTHLIQHGHQRIAFIGDALTVPTTERRFAGLPGCTCRGRYCRGLVTDLAGHRRPTHDHARHTAVAGPAAATHRDLFVQRPLHPTGRPATAPHPPQRRRAHQLRRLPDGRHADPLHQCHRSEPRQSRHFRRQAALRSGRQAHQAVPQAHRPTRHSRPTGILRIRPGAIDQHSTRRPTPCTRKRPDTAHPSNLIEAAVRSGRCGGRAGEERRPVARPPPRWVRRRRPARGRQRAGGTRQPIRVRSTTRRSGRGHGHAADGVAGPPPGERRPRSAPARPAASPGPAAARPEDRTPRG